MKLSNFELTKTQGNSPLTKVFFASVDVETGMLFWKKKERRMIRRKYAGHWHFVDTGKFTPAYQVEDLARAWEAQTGRET